MPPKRKADNSSSGLPAGKKLKKDGPPSTLIPFHQRTKAVKGVKDETLLHMLCVDTSKGNIKKELHFKKLIHAEIDWNNIEHIAKINSWRNQLYGRAGLKAKNVVVWHTEEEAWLELYFHVLVIEASKHGMMLPRPKQILDAFNAFFKGTVFKDKYGVDLPPRQVRLHNAFVSKLNRTTGKIRTRLEKMSLGKAGDFFFSKISQEMIVKYLDMKNQHLSGFHDDALMPDRVETMFAWANEDNEPAPEIAPYHEPWQTFFEELAAVQEDMKSDVDLDQESTPHNETSPNGSTASLNKTVIEQNVADDVRSVSSDSLSDPPDSLLTPSEASSSDSDDENTLRNGSTPDGTTTSMKKTKLKQMQEEERHSLSSGDLPDPPDDSESSSEDDSLEPNAFTTVSVEEDEMTEDETTLVGEEDFIADKIGVTATTTSEEVTNVSDITNELDEVQHADFPTATTAYNEDEAVALLQLSQNY